MRRKMFNLLALLVIGGGAHLLAQQTPATGGGTEEKVCCTAVKGDHCCGKSVCRAGYWTCCADETCD
ncbi:MAG TPA: hypothetical protein VFQ45_19880 [Longimicrobium sp.]|nr:hypothetical protein [Longimicrobium sp.]